MFTERNRHFNRSFKVVNKDSLDEMLPGVVLGGLNSGCSKRVTCWMHEPLDRLIDQAGLVVYTVDLKSGRITWQSGDQEKMLGIGDDPFTVEEWQSRVVEHTLIGSLEGADPIEARAAFWRGEAQVWETEFAYRKPDGSVQWFRNHMVPLLGHAGAITGGMGLLADIQPRVDRVKALISAEKRAKAIVQSAPLGIHIFETDESGQVRFAEWNPAAQSITNFNYEGWVGLTIQEAFGPFVDKVILDKIVDLSKTGGSWEGSYSAEAEGGQHRHFQVYAYASEPGRVVTFFDDSTEKVASQQKLMQSESKFRGLVENMSEGLVCISQAGTVNYASPGLGKLMEEDPSSLVGMSFFELVAPEHSPLMDRVLCRLSMGMCEPVEFKVLRASGERRWVRAMWQATEGGQGEINGVLLDINDRKKNEAALMFAEERMRLMLDAVGGQVAIVDVEGRIAFASPQWCRAVGFSGEGELLGMSGFNFLDSDGEAVARAMLMQAIAAKDRTPIIGCMLVHTNDGRLLDVKMTVVPMLDNPHIEGLVCQMEILRTRQKESAA